MALPLVHDVLSLDVRRLAREGYLRPKISYRWNWSWGGSRSCSVRLTVIPGEEPARAGAVVATWTLTNGTDMRQAVGLTWTPLHFGGWRPWWKCSCGRRAAIVYSTGRTWTCRTCARLAYPVQREGRMDRLWRKRNKIHERLGTEPCGLQLKPKRMHWSTWDRLQAEAADADRQAILLAVKRFAR